MPHSETSTARARGCGEDNGRWFALSARSVTALARLETARAYAAAGEQGQRDMANRLLADHISMAGAAEACVAPGSEILTTQDLRIDEIADAIHRRCCARPG